MGATESGRTLHSRFLSKDTGAPSCSSFPSLEAMPWYLGGLLASPDRIQRAVLTYLIWSWPETPGLLSTDACVGIARRAGLGIAGAYPLPLSPVQVEPPSPLEKMQKPASDPSLDSTRTEEGREGWGRWGPRQKRTRPVEGGRGLLMRSKVPQAECPSDRSQDHGI